MVSVLDSGLSGPGLSAGLGHCVVFLGKTFDSHSASLHPGAGGVGHGSRDYIRPIMRQLGDTNIDRVFES